MNNKNIITLGIGAQPGKIGWFVTSGLFPGLPVVPPVIRHKRKAVKRFTQFSPDHDDFTTLRRRK